MIESLGKQTTFHRVMNYKERKTTPPIVINSGDSCQTSEPLSVVLETNVLWVQGSL